MKIRLATSGLSAKASYRECPLTGKSASDKPPQRPLIEASVSRVRRHRARPIAVDALEQLRTAVTAFNEVLPLTFNR